MKRLILLACLLSVPAFSQCKHWSTARVAGQSILYCSDYRTMGTGAPGAGGCAALSDVGKIYVRTDAKAANASQYTCAQTGNGVFAWELPGGNAGTGTVLPETATYIPGDLAVFKNAAGTLIGTVSATGVLKISGSQPALATAADITALYGGGSCAGYLKSDGTCDTHPITRGFGYSFNGGGSALTAPQTGYLTVPYACTIAAWTIAVDAGTATVDVWKVATGTAIPTAANTITASATPAIASGTALRSTTLTGWTTAVAANDIVAFSLTAASGVSFLNITVECAQ
ncbi:MAG TPA: hypothetical protein VN428_02435 [Bryobacteraceae bacterium]|nr:hypothetical protein [Bryobacteraceae bacterium]